MELELLEKKEIWIRPIQIQEVNLSLVAEKVAEVLNLDKREVMVVDVREDTITLDILRKTIRVQDIIGKRDVLLQTLASISGISITPETSIHSEGVLGLIDVDDREAAKGLLLEMERMSRQISDHIRRRAVVFPSGFEIQKSLIQDTNSPYLKERLSQEGFKVTMGDVLEDDLESIVSTLRRALSEGFGLIITTGGVGAEHKGRMIEALLRLDPKASTPYIIRYEKGSGRHEKDGVRIGIAYVQPTLIIALPGPHEEVRLGIEVVLEGLKKGLDKETLAALLANSYVEFLHRIHHGPAC